MDYIYLNEYVEKMKQVAQECVTRVLNAHEDGKYLIKIPNLKREFGMQSIDETLLIDMLSERSEISIIEEDCDSIYVELSPEYIAEAKQTNLKVVSPQELKTMLAKHYLWLYDEYGGVQADLSNCYIENFNFDNQDMCSVVMNGAKFVSCSFWHTSMCSAECADTKFNSCNMMDITAEECNFYGSEFRYCRMERGVYTHSNFHNAKFVQNDMAGVSLVNACVAESVWVDNDNETTDMRNTVDSIEDWEGQGDVPGMKM